MEPNREVKKTKDTDKREGKVEQLFKVEGKTDTVIYVRNASLGDSLGNPTRLKKISDD